MLVPSPPRHSGESSRALVTGATPGTSSSGLTWWASPSSPDEKAAICPRVAPSGASRRGMFFADGTGCRDFVVRSGKDATEVEAALRLLPARGSPDEGTRVSRFAGETGASRLFVWDVPLVPEVWPRSRSPVLERFCATVSHSFGYNQ